MTETAEKPAPAIDYAEMTRLLHQDIRENGHPTTGYFEGRQVLLLTTTGARSGQPRTSALVFTRDAGRLIVCASKGGAPTHPAWYLNLVADPIVAVEVDRETFRARATVAEGSERQRLWDQHVAANPGFADYLNKTDRVIPVIVLERIAD